MFKKGNKINLGRKRLPFSKEWREKMSKASKGKPKSKEHRKKMYKFPKGHKSWNKGREMSDYPQCGFQMGHSLFNHMIGENHYNWQGGISKLYPIDWTEDLRESIRERDNYVCQMCGIHQDELDKKLNVHHKDYDKDNLNPENLITLCVSCHMKTNTYRNYWTNYFTSLC